MTIEHNEQTWHRYRLKVGAMLGEATHPFLRGTLRDVVLNLDYEGPPICGGLYNSLHNCFEECLSVANDNNDELEKAVEYDAELQDWAMNAHPGMCPDDIAEEILKLFG